MAMYVYHVLNRHFPSMRLFNFWLRGVRKWLDRLTVSRQDWWQEDRVWSAGVSLGFDVPQTLGAQLSVRGQWLWERKSEMDSVCPERVGHWCVIFHTVPQEKRMFPAHVFSGPRGALLWQRVTGQQRCSLSPVTQNLGQIVPGSCPETEEVRRRAVHSGNAPPLRALCCRKKPE